MRREYERLRQRKASRKFSQMKKRKENVVDAFWSPLPAWHTHGPVFPYPSFPKYCLLMAHSSLELPSVNGSHLLWEVINPEKKDIPQSATDGHRGTKAQVRMLQPTLQNSLWDQTRPDFSWDHVLAYFTSPVITWFPHSSSENSSSINHLLLNPWLMLCF